MQCEPIKLLFSKNIFKENKIINFFTKVHFVGLHKYMDEFVFVGKQANSKSPKALEGPGVTAAKPPVSHLF